MTKLRYRAQPSAHSRSNLVRQRPTARGPTDAGLFRALISNTSNYLHGVWEPRKTCKTTQSRVRITGEIFDIAQKGAPDVAASLQFDGDAAEILSLIRSMIDVCLSFSERSSRFCMALRHMLCAPAASPDFE